jgi:hypothetical protein
LTRVVKAADVADLGCEGHRDQKRGAAHRLVGLDHRRHRPARLDQGQLRFQAVRTLSGIRDRVDGLLKDDLLGSMLESLLGKPAPMRQRLVTAAAINPAVA